MGSLSGVADGTGGGLRRPSLTRLPTIIKEETLQPSLRASHWGVRRQSAPCGTAEGDSDRGLQLLSEAGDSREGGSGSGTDEESGSEAGSTSCGGRNCGQEETTGGGSPRQSLGGPQVSSWALLSSFDRGQLSREAEKFFRAGLFVGGARLWQDLQHNSSLAGSILSDGQQKGLAGYLRWSRYDNYRRLSRLIPVESSAAFVPASTLRGGGEGKPRLGSGYKGDYHRQSTPGVLLERTLEPKRVAFKNEAGAKRARHQSDSQWEDIGGGAVIPVETGIAGDSQERAIIIEDEEDSQKEEDGVHSQTCLCESCEDLMCTATQQS